MVYVEMYGRLVQKQYLRLLSKRHRNHHSLFFTAGQLSNNAIRELRDFGELEHVLHDLLVVPRGARKGPKVRRAP